MDVRVASWLNSQGHEATHLRDEGLQRLPNGEIFAKAVGESRVIVTFDLDFGEIVALSKGRKTGVILFRLRNTRNRMIDVRRSVLIFPALILMFACRKIYRLKQEQRVHCVSLSQKVC